jgi:15-cis-phytoene synthase
MSTPARSDLVQWAASTIARGSKSFNSASKILPGRVRENAWLLYAWCRSCDDLTDEQELGFQRSDNPLEKPDLWDLTRRALAGEAGLPPAFLALAEVQRDAGLPVPFIEDHLRGFDLDLAGWRPQDSWDLQGYCYHVAGAVGGLMAALMGVDPSDEDTLARASDLGIAFQLNNIARDLVEDARAGRCYLPGDWLAARGLAEHDLAEADALPALAGFAGDLNDMARRHDASARVGAARLRPRCRLAILAAANIYGAIGTKVVTRGEQAWESRSFTTDGEKLRAAGRAVLAAFRAPEPVSRDGLFNRADWYASGRLGEIADHRL